MLLVRVLGFVALVQCSIFGWFGSWSPIIEFEDATLESTIKRAHYSLIYFYMDGCKYCQSFEETFELMSTLYNNKTRRSDLDFQVLKINGKRNQRTNSLFGVEKYPTLKLLNRETMKITTFREPHRDIETLITFVDSFVEHRLYPNYNNLASWVLNVKGSDTEHLKKEGTLVVFIMSYARDWEFVRLKSHFYQRIAQERRDIKFALVELSDFDTSGLVQEYAVSTFPSAIYFDKDGRFKTFNTHSQNHLTNDRLEETKLRGFIENLHTDVEEYGTWFNNKDELNAFLDNSAPYTGHMQMPVYGVKFKHSNRDEEETDEQQQYSELKEMCEL